VTNSPSRPANSTSDKVPPAEAPGAFRRLKQDKLSWPVWLVIGYAGVALPILWHLATWSESPFPPDWQSGELYYKVAFTLSGSAGFVLYPLMLYPIVSLALLLYREARFANNLLVRFGVFSALPVTAWYCVILGICMFGVPSLLSPQMPSVFVTWGLGCVTPFVLWAIVRGLLWTRIKLHIPWVAILVIAVVIVGAIAVVEGTEPIIGFPVNAFLVSLLLGPYWCFDAYLAMTLRLSWCYPRPIRFTILQLMGVTSWLAALLAACRWAVILSLQEYAKLPLEPPATTCYIATAASRGHARFVGASTIRSRTGALWRINRQLIVLKAAELALRTLAPRLHARVRAIYDRLGPVIARHLTHPLLGDLAYLGLKPFEWISHWLLTCLLGQERHQIDRLYLRDEARHEQ
jgi:hypothetical protein